MEPFIIHNESVLMLEKWAKQFPGLTVGMTTKTGGFSQKPFNGLNLGFHVGDRNADVLANRRLVADLLGFPLEQWVGAEQTHQNYLQKILKLNAGIGAYNYEDAFKGTDGFYTSDTGILLTLGFADCVPLFFIAPDKKLIGIAHAGWKGTTMDIAGQMIRAWGKEGIQPGQIFAAIGPSICPKCYQVDERVINFVENALEEVDEKPYNLIEAGQYRLDLRLLNKLLMIKAGVPEENILTTSFCTSCDDLFFSHRRDLGKTGRMLSFIGWKE
jgi:YfiH family protein